MNVRPGPLEHRPRQLDLSESLGVGEHDFLVDIENQRRRQPPDHRDIRQQLLVAFRISGSVLEAQLRPPIAVPPVVVQEPGAKRGVGGALAGTVEGRVDTVTAYVNLFAQLFLERDAHHFRRVGGLHLHLETMALRTDRCGERGGVHIGVDEPELQHAAKHVVATGERALRIHDGIEARRSLGQSGEHRSRTESRRPLHRCDGRRRSC